MYPQKATAPVLLGSATVLEGCTEHPCRQPGLAGPRESSCSLPSWEQQNPGRQGMWDTHTHLPVLGHHPDPTHKVYWWGVSGCCPNMWLPWGGCSGTGLLRAALPGRTQPARGSQPGVPQPGCCLPVGAELRRMARVIPHLPAPLEKQQDLSDAAACRLLLGLPSLVVPVPLPKPLFLLPAPHCEPSSCIAVPAPPRPSGSPSSAVRPTGLQGQVCSQANRIAPSPHSSLLEA